MYVVPILSVERVPGAITQHWIFLERNGNHLIQLDTSEADAVQAATAFAAFNEMAIVGEPVVVGDLVFLHVDPACKDIHSFYTWREVAPGTIPGKELWRPFLWVTAGGTAADPLGVNKLLDSITLSEQKHTVHTLISSYLAA